MKMTMQERFDKYHEKHPLVYQAFDKLARQLIRSGVTKGSAYAIYQRMRWDYSIGAKEYRCAPKLSNNWTPFYARLWLHNNPEYEGFFVTKKTKADLSDIDNWTARVKGDDLTSEEEFVTPQLGCKLSAVCGHCDNETTSFHVTQSGKYICVDCYGKVKGDE